MHYEIIKAVNPKELEDKVNMWLNNHTETTSWVFKTKLHGGPVSIGNYLIQAVSYTFTVK